MHACMVRAGAGRKHTARTEGGTGERIPRGEELQDGKHLLLQIERRKIRRRERQRQRLIPGNETNRTTERKQVSVELTCCVFAELASLAQNEKKGRACASSTTNDERVLCRKKQVRPRFSTKRTQAQLTSERHQRMNVFNKPGRPHVPADEHNGSSRRDRGGGGVGRTSGAFPSRRSWPVSVASSFSQAGCFVLRAFAVLASRWSTSTRREGGGFRDSGRGGGGDGLEEPGHLVDSKPKASPDRLFFGAPWKEAGERRTEAGAGAKWSRGGGGGGTGAETCSKQRDAYYPNNIPSEYRI